MAVDFVQFEDLALHSISRMLLSPTLWTKFKVASTKLRWKQIKYSSSNVSKVPEKRGVYAFLIRNALKQAAWPPHGYIMYVGIAGRGKAKRTLRKRFSEYLTPSELAKRHKLARLVRTWRDHLYFNYAVVPEQINLETVERTLLGAIVPPCNRGDLPIEIRAAVKAFM